MKSFVKPILSFIPLPKIEWIENIRAKIDEAIAISEPPVDREALTNQILTRFQK